MSYQFEIETRQIIYWKRQCFFVLQLKTQNSKRYQRRQSWSRALKCKNNGFPPTPSKLEFYRFNKEHARILGLSPRTNLDATTFLQFTCDHWQIENGLHWVKDITLQEDYPPRWGGCAPSSWAVFNSFLIPLARCLGTRTIPDCIRDRATQVHQVFHWLT
jgi:hypothetical protein